MVLASRPLPRAPDCPRVQRYSNQYIVPDLDPEIRRSPAISISRGRDFVSGGRPLQWVSSTARDRTFHKWIELAKCEFTPHTTVASFDTAGWGPGGKMGWGPGRGQGSRPGENLGMGSNWAKFILKSGGSGLGSRSGSSSGRAPVTVYPVAQIDNPLNCSVTTCGYTVYHQGCLSYHLLCNHADSSSLGRPLHTANVTPLQVLLPLTTPSKVTSMSAGKVSMENSVARLVTDG